MSWCSVGILGHIFALALMADLLKASTSPISRMTCCFSCGLSLKPSRKKDFFPHSISLPNPHPNPLGTFLLILSRTSVLEGQFCQNLSAAHFYHLVSTIIFWGLCCHDDEFAFQFSWSRATPDDTNNKFNSSEVETKGGQRWTMEPRASMGENEGCHPCNLAFAFVLEVKSKGIGGIRSWDKKISKYRSL